MQSIEHALRSLEKAAEQEQERAARAEKMLADYQEQAGKPFEHESRLKELLVRQAAVNAALDLDKGERQVAPEDGGGETAEAAPADPRPERRNGGPPRAATRNRNSFDPAQAAATAPKPPSVPGTRF